MQHVLAESLCMTYSYNVFFRLLCFCCTLSGRCICVSRIFPLLAGIHTFCYVLHLHRLASKPVSVSESTHMLHAFQLLMYIHESAGDESKVMLDAHCDAGYLVGQPFATEGLYDFATHSALSRKIAALGGVMLKHRLTAPPEEAYSLHRKLSGAFLACIKLGSQVPCRDILVDCAQGYKFD